MRMTKALSLVRRHYRQLPLSDRVHILGRFASCPFLRVLPLLRPGSDVLDFGAGHGVFALLALESGARSVVALEPDLRKVLMSAPAVRARWVTGFDSAIRGSFDVVTLFDVLYRIPMEERDDLFHRLFARLRPGGRIMIKELDPSRSVKFAWNRTQEWISDRFLGLTLGSAFAYEPPDAVSQRLRRAGFVDVQSNPIDAFYPHSHILYVASRAG